MTKKFKLPDRTIYHYCSAASLLNILSNFSIFLSYSQHLNDSMESKWIRKIFINSKNQANVKFDSFSTDNVRKILSRYNGEAYLACFSGNKDTLSQWRAYADDGFGVSIGFNFQTIKKTFPNNLKLAEIIYHEQGQNRAVMETLQNHLPYKTYNPLKLKPCELEEKLHKEYHHTRVIAENNENLWEEICENSKIKLSEIAAGKNFKYESSEKIAQCTKDLIILSHFLKNEAFHEEDEYRLCYLPNISKVNITPSEHIGNLEHRYSNKRIVPYYPFKFEKTKNIIKEIVLGPRCQIDIYTMQSLLRKFGYKKVAISRSSASYR